LVGHSQIDAIDPKRSRPEFEAGGTNRPRHRSGAGHRRAVLRTPGLLDILFAADHMLAFGARVDVRRRRYVAARSVAPGGVASKHTT
jgi:hypothetical protein